MRGGLWVTPWIGVVLCSSALARAECSKDTECKADRICEAGQCVAPSPSVVPSPSAAPPARQSSPSAAPPVTQATPLRERFFDDEEPRNKPRKRIGNPALMTAGIVVAASGPTLWMVGVMTTSCDRSVGGECNAGPRLLAFFVGGLALIGTGIPMIVIGAKRVPVRRVTAVPWFGPRQGGLQLQLAL